MTTQNDLQHARNLILAPWVRPDTDSALVAARDRAVRALDKFTEQSASLARDGELSLQGKSTRRTAAAAAALDEILGPVTSAVDRVAAELVTGVVRLRERALAPVKSAAVGAEFGAAAVEPREIRDYLLRLDRGQRMSEVLAAVARGGEEARVVLVAVLTAPRLFGLIDSDNRRAEMESELYRLIDAPETERLARLQDDLDSLRRDLARLESHFRDAAGRPAMPGIAVEPPLTFPALATAAHGIERPTREAYPGSEKVPAPKAAPLPVLVA